MRRIFGLFAALILIGAAPTTDQRDVPTGGMTDVTINGAALHLRLDPAAPGAPLVAPQSVARAGLRMARMIGIGFAYSVGSTHVIASSAVAKVDFGKGVTKRRVVWADRPFADAGDGSLGPFAVPEPVVRFALRAPQPNQQTFSIPMVRSGFTLFGAHWGFSYGEISVGGAPMRILIDPYHRRTLATAGAAARLAQQGQGEITGTAVPTEIFFGVERPVRTMRLRQPLRIGTLSVATLGVRIQDYGAVTSIREAGTSESTPDPDEIVVVGKGKKRDMRRDTLSLGADVLNACSSVVFDKTRQTIFLTCART